MTFGRNIQNVIKIDECNFELYYFKVGASFETQCPQLTKSLKAQKSVICLYNYC